MGDMVHFIDLYQQDTEKYFERRHCGHHGQAKIYYLFKYIFLSKNICTEILIYYQLLLVNDDYY